MTLSTAFIRRGLSPLAGNVVDLDGDTAFIEKASAELWAETDFTVALRIKPHTLEAATIFSMAAHGLSGVSEYFRLRIIPSGLQFHVWIQTIDQAGAVAVSARSNLRISPGAFSTIVYKDANGAGQFYINGAKDTATISYTRPALAAMNRTMIGATIALGAVTDYFDGEVDVRAFAVYDSALSDANAAKIPGNRPGPIVSFDAKASLELLLPLDAMAVGVTANASAKRDAHVTATPSPAWSLGTKKLLPLNALRPTLQIEGILSKQALINDMDFEWTVSVASDPIVLRKLPLDALQVGVTFVANAVKAVNLPLDPLQVGVSVNARTGGQRLNTITNEEFRYEVRDSSGVLKGILGGVHRAEYEENVNEPAFLRFLMPVDGNDADQVIRGREIWVRDMRVDDYLDKLDIIDVSDVIDNPAKLRVECDGRLARLGLEFVEPYSAADADYKDVIQAVLAFQQGGSPITLSSDSSGFPTTKWSGSFEFVSILEALSRIRESTGGFYFVAPGTLKLVWKSAITPARTNTRFIAEGVNASRIERRLDFSKICTRCYGTGAGEGTARVTLKDAGEAEYYIDSDTVGTYGIHARHVSWPHITDSAVLKEAVLKFIEDHKHPVERITADVVEAIEE